MFQDLEAKVYKVVVVVSPAPDRFDLVDFAFGGGVVPRSDRRDGPDVDALFIASSSLYANVVGGRAPAASRGARNGPSPLRRADRNRIGQAGLSFLSPVCRPNPDVPGFATGAEGDGRRTPGSLSERKVMDYHKTL